MARIQKLNNVNDVYFIPIPFVFFSLTLLFRFHSATFSLLSLTLALVHSFILSNYFIRIIGVTLVYYLSLVAA